MCERKAWTQQEDQLLASIMRECGGEGGQRLRWNEIAGRVSGAGTARRGKQCRERWFNQLHPLIAREAEWTAEEEERLFALQRREGNRWARIAKQLPGRSDNNIKNYFYSTLRKALRRLNNYVTLHKHLPTYKNVKAFQPATLNKVLAVAENKASGKIIVAKQGARALAREIRDALIRMQLAHKDHPALTHTQDTAQLIAQIQDFNRACKRRKTKKKEFYSSENEEQPSESAEGQEELQGREEEEESAERGEGEEGGVTVLGGGGAGKEGGTGSCQGQAAASSDRLSQVGGLAAGESGKVRLPIIPSLLLSNCPSSEPSINKSLQTGRDSLFLHSHSPPPPPSAQPNLSFIPYLQSTLFTAPAFPPFFPFPSGYSALAWSEQFPCHNPFGKTSCSIQSQPKQ